MKKLGVLFLVSFFAIQLSANTYSGYCGANGSDLNWELDTNTGILTISGSGDMRDFDWMTWGNYRSYITSVSLPDGLTSIGESAFHGCSNLASVVIPNSVISIGNQAFRYCSSLASVIIGNSVMTIGNYSFSDCSTLASVTIGNSVMNIGEFAFNECSILASITIPNSVTSIEHHAFAGCSGLTVVTIGNGVTSIGEDAFSDCSNLTRVDYTGDIAQWCYITFSEVLSNPLYYAKHLFINNTEVTDLVIPNNVGWIKSYSFICCSNFSSVTIPNSVTRIGDWAFYLCSGLTSITIPNNVTIIGDYAFFLCSGLTSITIPYSVRTIGNSAFSQCSGLASIIIPNSVTSIGDNAFYNVPNIVYNGIATGSPWGARCKNGCVDGYLVYTNTAKTQLVACSSAATGNITIPNSVTSIGDYAFRDCSGLTSITIPNSVTSIGRAAFRYCSGLASISVNAGNSVYDSRNNCNAIIETQSNKLIQGCNNSTIPYSVTSIGDYAFYDCSSLTSVTIPNGVTSIGDYAFEYCSGLTSVTIPNSVTSIGYEAFRNCSGLTSVTIGNGVTKIAERAFYNCAALTSVSIPNSVTSIGRSAFSYCSGLTSVTIPNSVTSIGDYAFEYCSGLTSVTIPYSVTSIGRSAFSYCSGLTSVTIPNSVTSIGDDAFSFCSSLTSVTIPSSVTSIGSDAFWGCSALTSVTIPNSVTSIGNYAFYGCSGLTSITIPNSVTSIGNYAFYGRSSLQTIYAHPTTLPTLGGTSVFYYDVPTSAILYVPTESKSAYQGATLWKNFTTIRELHDVTVGSAEWASLCLPYDAEIPEGVTVYQGEVGNGYVSLSEIEQSNMLPANTGCVINAPAGTYTFLQTTETPTAVQNNDIHGVTVETEYSNLYNAQTETLLTLGLDNDDNVGFHQPNTTYSPQMEAYKAYILYPGVAQAPLRILMPGENPIATGVEQTLFDSPLKGECVKAMLNGQLVIARGGHHYDLNGKIIK